MIQLHNRSLLKLMRKGDAETKTATELIEDALTTPLQVGDELEFVATDWHWIPVGSRCTVTKVDEHWFYVAWKEAAHRKIDSGSNWPLDIRRSSFKLVGRREEPTKADHEAAKVALLAFAYAERLSFGDLVEVVYPGSKEHGQRGRVICPTLAEIKLDNGEKVSIYSRSCVKLIRKASDVVLQIEGQA
jgi:hypothetical protein